MGRSFLIGNGDHGTRNPLIHKRGAVTPLLGDGVRPHKLSRRCKETEMTSRMRSEVVAMSIITGGWRTAVRASLGLFQS